MTSTIAPPSRLPSSYKVTCSNAKNKKTKVRQIDTFGEASKYTFKHKWAHTKSEKVAVINKNHFLKVAGLTTPLYKAEQGHWWTQVISELREDHPQWTDSTLNRVITAGTTMVRFCRSEGLTTVDCAKPKKGQEGEHRFWWYSKEDVENLAFIAVDIFDRLALSEAIVFSAYTGVRQNELLQMRIEDIDWKMNNVWVGGLPTRVNKGKECRAVPIHDRIRDLLVRRTEGKAPRDYLFGSEWTNKDALYRQFKRVRAQAGFEDCYTWHALRHSFATWLGEVSHPRQIMELCGHKDMTTTLRYCKPTDAAQRTAINAL